VYFRRAIRFRVVILIGIKQQIRGIQDPSPVLPRENTRNDIEIGYEIVIRFVSTISITVLKNGHTIKPGNVIRWRDRNLIVDSSKILVVTNYLEASRKWILSILHDPHPTFRIKIHREWLFDDWLGRDQLDAHPADNLELFDCHFGRRRLAIIGQGALPFKALNEPLNFFVGGRRRKFAGALPLRKPGVCAEDS
jgi:hypothetical protein